MPVRFPVEVIAEATAEATAEPLGKVSETHEAKEFEWEIANISELAYRSRGVFRYRDSSSFCFSGNSWHLKVEYGVLPYIYFFLIQENPGQYPVDYVMGFKRNDGIVEYQERGTIKKGEVGGLRLAMSLSEFEERKSEIAPSGVMTIVCSLKRGQPHIPKPLGEPRRNILSNLEGFSQSFRNLLLDTASCDTTLRVEKEQFKAHRFVLSARSPVFRALFSNDMLEKETGIVTITDCPSSSFSRFLEYLYCGELAASVPFSTVCDLYRMSDKYDVHDLKVACVENLKESLAVENVCEVLILADLHNETVLFSAARDFFNRCKNAVVGTAAWKSLMEENRTLGNKLLADYHITTTTIFPLPSVGPPKLSRSLPKRLRNFEKFRISREK